MYEAIIEFANGKQTTATFDHAPTLGAVVQLPGTATYGTVLAVWRLPRRR